MAITFSAEPATELEAVNSMLLSIGKSPVNTTAVPGINDVSNALTTLYNTVREVQSRRWWFNYDTCYVLTPDSNGNVARPNSCSGFAPSERWRNYVERYNPASSTMCLWDLDTKTFNLTPLIQGSSLKCDVQWVFAFEQVPQVARSFIARKAGRIFQTNVVGSQLIYQFTKEMELDAASELEREHLKFSRTNMFSSPTINNRIVNRQPGAYYWFGV
jgi:hypothetical protein